MRVLICYSENILNRVVASSLVSISGTLGLWKANAQSLC